MRTKLCLSILLIIFLTTLIGQTKQSEEEYTKLTAGLKSVNLELQRLRNQNALQKTEVEKLTAVHSFSEDEIAKFKLIKKYYPEFEYSPSYVNTSEHGKKMIFVEGFLEYDYYETIVNTEQIITNIFEAGHAYFGYNSYFMIDDNNIIKVEKSAGTSAYCYVIYTNGVKIAEKWTDYDFYEKAKS